MEDSKRASRGKKTVSVVMDDLIIGSEHLCGYISTISLRILTMVIITIK